MGKIWVGNIERDTCVIALFLNEKISYNFHFSGYCFFGSSLYFFVLLLEICKSALQRAFPRQSNSLPATVKIVARDQDRSSFKMYYTIVLEGEIEEVLPWKKIADSHRRLPAISEGALKNPLYLTSIV